jgi:hypothetical protein
VLDLTFDSNKSAWTVMGDETGDGTGENGRGAFTSASRRTTIAFFFAPAMVDYGVLGSEIEGTWQR